MFLLVAPLSVAHLLWLVSSSLLCLPHLLCVVMVLVVHGLALGGFHGVGWKVGTLLVSVVTLVWLGVFRASLRPAWGFLALS